MLQGRHEPGFEPLAEALGGLLAKSGGGTGLAVYHEGKLVFDMWGGTRNAEGDPWERNTASVSFSTTKGVASTALHILADRCEVDYAAPVARYWPEFAQNGKGDITVEDVMSHRAGLYDVRSLVEHADILLDWDATVKMLAEAAAKPVPGGGHAYHAMTYGHLVGEIVRRVSGKEFSAFVQEEIADPLGLEHFWIGAPASAIASAARIPPFPRREPNKPKSAASRARSQKRRRRTQMIQRGLRLAGLPVDFSRLRNALAPRGIETWDFSSQRVLEACIPSANGLFTARDLARMYACLSMGGELDGVRLMSAETVRRASRKIAKGPDGVLVFPMGWRLGYHAVPTMRGVPKQAFGHYGYGGSGAWADPRRRMSVGLTVNAGVGTPVGDWRILKLSGVALSCVRSVRRRAA